MPCIQTCPAPSSPASYFVVPGFSIVGVFEQQKQRPLCDHYIQALVSSHLHWNAGQQEVTMALTHKQ